MKKDLFLLGVKIRKFSVQCSELSVGKAEFRKEKTQSRIQAAENRI
jgi:hypothetical protein